MNDSPKLSHTGTVPLETERLNLRRMSVSDAPQMFENWANDPEVTKFMLWDAHKGVVASEERLALWEGQYSEPDFYQWGIEIKETGQLIGTASVVNMRAAHLSCELGWCIGRRFWNRGITSEAVAAVIKHLFNNAGFNRIAAHHFADNTASGRVMQKTGMTFEGISRQCDYMAKLGGFVDVACYAVCKSDYPK